MQNRALFLRTMLLVMCSAPAARAAFQTPTTWNRGDPYSTYQQWNFFTNATGANLPDVGEWPNATTAPHPPRAAVTDTSGGAFITSGSNIYSFSVPLDIDVDVPDYALGNNYLTTVILQTKTLGTEADYSTVRLTYNDGTDNHTVYPAWGRKELSRTVLGGFGGDDVENGFEFDLPFSASQFKIEFIALGSSMSLDMIAVDTITTRKTPSSALLGGMNPGIGWLVTPVPEPACMGVVALTSGLVLCRRRRARGC